jgi:nucleotide-binding universal stress UspA family protein
LPALYGAGVIALTGKNPDAREVTRQALIDLAKTTSKAYPKTTAHFIEGKAAESILQLSKELEVDVIVMSSGGLSGLKRLVLGSIAAAVVKKSQIPVMIVKQKGEGRQNSLSKASQVAA